MKTVREVLEKPFERYGGLVFIREGHDIKMYDCDDGIDVIPPEILRRKVKFKKINKMKRSVQVEIDI